MERSTLLQYKIFFHPRESRIVNTFVFWGSGVMRVHQRPTAHERISFPPFFLPCHTIIRDEDTMYCFGVWIIIQRHNHKN